MRVAVTGSSGTLGRAVVQELIEQGHEVLAMDRINVAEAVAQSHARLNERLIRKGLPPEPPPTVPEPHPDARQITIDLCDYPAVRGVLKDVQAVIHLAATPTFGWSHQDQVDGFKNNVQSTYTVFEAAAEVDVSRMVYASSIQVYGCTHMNTPTGRGVLPPVYLPVDEAHPLCPSTPYAASKLVGEEIAMLFHRRHPDWVISALRYTAITDRIRYRSSSVSKEEGLRRLMVGALMTRISTGQAARATVLAMLREQAGFEAFNISEPAPIVPWNVELLERAYGTVPEIRKDLSGEQTLFSVAKAQRMLNFVAEPLKA